MNWALWKRGIEVNGLTEERGAMNAEQRRAA
jgi:hypothetical protein